MARSASYPQRRLAGIRGWAAALLAATACACVSAPADPQETPPAADAAPDSGDADTLGEALAETEGVITPPPSAGDPAMVMPPPDEGTAVTPVIPPPGSPGGDPTMEPR